MNTDDIPAYTMYAVGAVLFFGIMWEYGLLLPAAVIGVVGYGVWWAINLDEEDNGDPF